MPSIKKFQEVFCIKKNIKQIIEKLDNNEQKTILKILINEKIPYTKNNNGYFFNMNHYTNDSDILKQIYKTLLSMDKNSSIIKNIDDDRNKFVIECKLVIEQTLLNAITKKKNDYYTLVRKIPEYNYTNIACSFNKIIKEYKNTFTKSKINRMGSVECRINEYIKKSKSRARIYDTKKYYHESYIEEYNDNDNDNDNDHDNDLESSEIDLEESCEIDLNIEESFEIDLEKEEEDTYDIEQSELIEEDFYINLLKKNGYEINTDKSCLLICEEYI